MNAIPKFQPDWLAKGRTLVARWKLEPSPAYSQPRDQAKKRHSIADTSPTKSRKASNTAVRPSQTTVEEPDHRRTKSGGSEQCKKSSVTKDKYDRESAETEKTQAESVDPAILSSSYQIRDPAPNSGNFTETDRSSQVGQGTDSCHPDTEEKSSGSSSNMLLMQQPSTGKDTAPSEASEVPSSPSALDGTQETATPSKANSPKKNKSKANSLKKLSVPENKKEEPSSGISYPEKAVSFTEGKKAARSVRGKKARGFANTKAKDRKVDPETDPTKPSSSTASPATNAVNLKDQAASKIPTSATNAKNSQHDANLVAGQKHASPTSGSMKRDKAYVATTNETSKAAAAANNPSQGQKPTSQAMTRDTSNSTYEGGASTPSVLNSTAATSSLHTERSNSVAEDGKPSQLFQGGASVPGVDPDLLRNKLEDNVTGLGVTYTLEKLLVRDAPGTEGQSTSASSKSNSTEIIATTPSRLTDASQPTSTPVPEKNHGAEVQTRCHLPAVEPPLVGKCDQGKSVSQKPQVKNNSLGKKAKTATKTENKTDVKTDMKTDVKTDEKRGAKPASKASMAGMTEDTDHTEKGPQSVHNIGIHGTTHEGISMKTSGKAPRTLAANMSPHPSPSASGQRSPEHKQPPQIPERSSSLAVQATPVETRRKKKAKNFTPREEEAKVSDQATSDEQASVGSDGL